MHPSSLSPRNAPPLLSHPRYMKGNRSYRPFFPYPPYSTPAHCLSVHIPSSPCAPRRLPTPSPHRPPLPPQSPPIPQASRAGQQGGREEVCCWPVVRDWRFSAGTSWSVVFVLYGGEEGGVSQSVGSIPFQREVGARRLVIHQPNAGHAPTHPPRPAASLDTHTHTHIHKLIARTQTRSMVIGSVFPLACCASILSICFRVMYGGSASPRCFIHCVSKGCACVGWGRGQRKEDGRVSLCG